MRNNLFTATNPVDGVLSPLAKVLYELLLEGNSARLMPLVDLSQQQHNVDESGDIYVYRHVGFWKRVFNEQSSLVKVVSFFDIMKQIGMLLEEHPSLNLNDKQKKNFRGAIFNALATNNRSNLVLNLFSATMSTCMDHRNSNNRDKNWFNYEESDKNSDNQNQSGNGKQSKNNNSKQGPTPKSDANDGASGQAGNTFNFFGLAPSDFITGERIEQDTYKLIGEIKANQKAFRGSRSRSPLDFMDPLPGEKEYIPILREK